MADGNVKWCIPPWNVVRQFLKVRTGDPAIPPLGINPRELKISVHTEIYT